MLYRLGKSASKKLAKIVQNRKNRDLKKNQLGLVGFAVLFGFNWKEKRRKKLNRERSEKRSEIEGSAEKMNKTRRRWRRRRRSERKRGRERFARQRSKRKEKVREREREIQSPRRKREIHLTKEIKRNKKWEGERERFHQRKKWEK